MATDRAARRYAQDGVSIGGWSCQKWEQRREWDVRNGDRLGEEPTKPANLLERLKKYKSSQPFKQLCQLNPEALGKLLHTEKRQVALSALYLPDVCPMQANLLFCSLL